jgi:hypothetical protein
MKTKTIVIIILLLWVNGLYSQEKSEKSLTPAFGYAIGGTVLFTGLGITLNTVNRSWTYKNTYGSIWMTTGMCACPSLGHVYARNWSRACLFTLLRGITYAGTLLLAESIDEKAQTLNEYVVEYLVLIGGGSLYVTLTVTDWLLISSSIHKYNEKLMIKPEIDFQKKSYGIGLIYTFQ